LPDYAETPRVSIVTVVLNGVGTIERCLNSVWRQREHVIEHIVVDGGSVDGTVDILVRRAAVQPGFLSFTSEPDQGISDGFNEGIRRVQGDWVGLLNADDWYEDGALAIISANMDQEVILHGRMRLHDPKTGASRESGRLDYDPARHFRPLETMPAQHPTCFVPRSVYQRIGPFNTEFRLAMDYEFLLRAHLAGVEFHYLPEVITNFDVSGASAQSGNAARREMMAAQILHRGKTWGPRWLYAKDVINTWLRRLRRWLLRRPIR
jgi:glycosyltransferase involved in cell wall biosynthesis